MDDRTDRSVVDLERTARAAIRILSDRPFAEQLADAGRTRVRGPARWRRGHEGLAVAS